MNRVQFLSLALLLLNINNAYSNIDCPEGTTKSYSEEKYRGMDARQVFCMDGKKRIQGKSYNYVSIKNKNHTSIKKAQEITWKNNEVHGYSKSWYKSKQLERHIEFKHGKMHGTFKMWHENGQIQVEGQYVNGEQVGVWKKYFSNGEIENTHEYPESL